MLHAYDRKLALKFSDRILFMKEGSIVHQHHQSEQLDVTVIKNVFGVDASIIELAELKRQWVCF